MQATPTPGRRQRGRTNLSIFPKCNSPPSFPLSRLTSHSRRVFLLGPSHHLYLSNCALSLHSKYSTPLGDLPLDLDTISELRNTGEFRDLTTPQDTAEHSLEMHLPYIYHVLSQSFPTDHLPLLVPIMVGSTSASTETKYGKLLAPYLADPTSVFVISSDFCHWGSRFSYTYYLPSSAAGGEGEGISLRKNDSPQDPPIHASIGAIDHSAMQAISSGSHEAFLTNLRRTKNTVCGRHPIGVVMAAVEELKRQGKVEEGKGLFRFVRYERSSEVEDARDSSVSYASAFAVI